MPAYYTYLISSLPMLNFAAKPPFSFRDFIEKCRGLLPEKNLEILEFVSVSGEHPLLVKNKLLKEWYEFDAVLRNELVKLRAARKKISPAAYLRGSGFSWPKITRIATNAQKMLAPLEAERSLDEQRWHFLDELCVGHYFDFEYLIVYAIKLFILERWQTINSADKNKILEEVLV